MNWEKFKEWLVLAVLNVLIALCAATALVAVVLDLFNIRIVWSPW